ncbi:hypothetical protein TWF730_009863 [Orbilia blumenaviensis]|uniref:BTB domain-containing protein n=1 Tax=Orbilia blumenaviensis TaxID=1796055 RepID=A0AAV9UTV6_9PEZI
MGPKRSIKDLRFKESPLYAYGDPDATIVVGDDEIQAHEYVLASQSEFFKAAFRSECKEFIEKRFTLPEIEPEIVYIVLNWLYRVPLKSPLPPDIRRAFAKEPTKKLVEVLQAFDFLQIKGAGEEYGKFVEDALKDLGFHDEYPYPEDFKNIVTMLNEVYKANGTMAGGSLERLASAMTRGGVENRAMSEFLYAMRHLPDPDGECFRDIAMALGRELAALRFKSAP